LSPDGFASPDRSGFAVCHKVLVVDSSGQKQ
jgi:hypothetical protein